MRLNFIKWPAHVKIILEFSNEHFILGYGSLHIVKLLTRLGLVRAGLFVTVFLGIVRFDFTLKFQLLF